MQCIHASDIDGVWICALIEQELNRGGTAVRNGLHERSESNQLNIAEFNFSTKAVALMDSPALGDQLFELPGRAKHTDVHCTEPGLIG